MTGTPPADGGVRERLRHAGRAARRALDAEQQAANAAAVAAAAATLTGRARPAVGCYLATDGEVDLGPAMAAVVAAGGTVWLPVVGADRSMAFARWTPGETLLANRFGIGEPTAGAPRRTIAELDVVLVPCVAVDRQGRRLGFGAGYYDRALGTGRPPLVVGVVHEVQVVDAVPAEDHDQPLDALLTECGVRFVGQRAAPA